MTSKDVEDRVRALHTRGKTIRAIARALEISRKRVRRIVREKPALKPEEDKKPSLLAPFRARIETYAKDELTVSLILQKIQGDGYLGGRTILEDYVRNLRGPNKRARKPHARFETAPAEEAQQDWSTYTAPIGGKPQRFQLFSLILAWSRHQYLRAFRDQRLPALLWGHVHAFRYFQGIPWRIVYDNQTTITPFRIQGEAVLTDKFREFQDHYGFKTFVCDPGDCERKGKVERPFYYFQKAFLPTRSFESFEDLNRQIHEWLDSQDPPTGNRREHGTTGEVPYDRWLEEKKQLYGLPATDHLPRTVESRLVHSDSTISVLAVRYSVPVAHAGKKVWVSLGDGDFEVYDERGNLVLRQKIHQGKSALVIDESHYAPLRRKKTQQARTAIERELLSRFPGAEAFLDALKREVRSTTPIHLREILDLAGRYRAEEVSGALKEALRDGTPTASYVRELLSRKNPTGHIAELSAEVPKGLSLGPVDCGNAEGFKRIFKEPEERKENK